MNGSKNRREGEAAIPREQTWFTTSHSNDFDIVNEHQIKHTDWGYTLKTSTIIVNYKDSNSNGIWDKGDSRKFEKYGSRTVSYYEFGTPEEYKNSPYTETHIAAATV